MDSRLKVDQDVEVKIEGSVVKTETRSNQDGTVDRVYIIKPTKVEIFE